MSLTTNIIVGVERIPPGYRRFALGNFYVMGNLQFKSFQLFKIEIISINFVSYTIWDGR